jgi:raffinose/stachyose/melibiose transport system substrate-binding protein
MRLKRILAGVLATTALAAGFAGCSGGASPSAATSSAPSQEKVELKIWWVTMTDSWKKAWDTMVTDFEAANPNITIVTEQRSIDAHKEALRQVAGTKAGPDVYWYWEGPGLGGSLIKAGMSKDLTDYYKQYNWESRFSPAVLSGITQYGGFNGVPFTLQGQALFYNKKLFAQAGITTLPTDYNGLLAAADKLSAKGITPIEFGGTVNWHLMRLLDNLIEARCGTDNRDKLFAKQANWAETSCVTDAFTDMKTWVDKYINKGFISQSNDDSSQLFYQGKAAMALEGSWFDANIKDNGMDPSTVGIFPFPTGTSRLYAFGEGLYINNSTPNADAAAKFLDFVTNKDAQAKSAGVFAALSVNKEVQPKSDNPLNALWPPIFEASKGTFVNSDQALSLEETTEYWRIQNAVAIGKMAPGEAAKAMQAFFDSHQ